jgi:hypothetical protein
LAIHSSRPANIGGCIRTTTGSPLLVAFEMLKLLSGRSK